MAELLDFYRRLHANNHREWFDAHRKEWERVKRSVAELAEGLLEGIASFDDSVRGLRAQDCTYRIARDTRFSPDKTPYKNWCGIFVCPHGKHSGYAGYYLHIAPCGDRGGKAEYRLYAGLYCPEPQVMRSVREEILDHGDELVANIRKARGFRPYDEVEMLKRTPVGFPAGTPYDELLRMKEWGVQQDLSEAFLLADDLAGRVAERFRETAPLVAQLNRAVQYAREEMR